MNVRIETKEKQNELEQIKKVLFESDVLFSEFEFDCFAENVITYVFNDGVNIHEINIVNEDKMFMKKEKAIDLCENEGLTFLQHNIFAETNEDEKIHLTSKTFRKPFIDDFNFNFPTDFTEPINDEQINIGDIFEDLDTNEKYIVLKIHHEGENVYMMSNQKNDILLDYFCDKQCLDEFEMFKKIGNIQDISSEDEFSHLLNVLCR